MKERSALFLLGAWVMGSLVLLVVAPTNFRLIDELLSNSENASFRGLVERVGHDVTRELLRYLSSELNRKFFLLWNVAQLCIGIALVGFTRGLPGARRVHAAVQVAMWMVALLVILQPMITAFGRQLDFVPRDPPPPELARFQLLHVAYTVIELLKLVFAGLAGFWLVRAAPSEASPGR
jgi:hypothetical protein